MIQAIVAVAAFGLMGVFWYIQTHMEKKTKGGWAQPVPNSLFSMLSPLSEQIERQDEIVRDLAGAVRLLSKDIAEVNREVSTLRGSVTIVKEAPFDPAHPSDAVRLYAAERVYKAVEEAKRGWIERAARGYYDEQQEINRAVAAKATRRRSGRGRAKA